MEIIGVFLLNDVLHAFYNFGDNIGFLIDKCIITVIVIILNFLLVNFLLLRKNKKSGFATCTRLLCNRHSPM